MNLVKPRTRLEVRSNFFSVRTVDDWNGLPENIIMSVLYGSSRSCISSIEASGPGRSSDGRSRDRKRQQPMIADSFCYGPRWPDGRIPK
jgi:hypothetical protein